MIVQYMAQVTGASEPALRLLLGIIFTFPVSYLWNLLFIKPYDGKKPLNNLTSRHLASVAIGLWLSWFLYDKDFIHFPLSVTLCWLVMRIIPKTRALISAAFVFVFMMTYLLVSYHYYASEDYSIDFTSSFCVLTLRLIGFAIDYYDGQYEESDKTSRTVKVKRNIWDNVEFTELPSLLETLSYAMFFNGFIVGPQFPYAAYKDFLSLDKFKDQKGVVRVPKYTLYGVKCLLLGLIYISLVQVFGKMFPTSYMITEQFVKDRVWKKLLMMIVSGRLCLIKYLGIWTLNEFGTVLSGMSFSGYQEVNGKVVSKWDGIANVDPYIFETVTSLTNVIQSFNINTNMWCKQYIFKRLKFLNNKNLSSLGALGFLAVWHGFSFGYFGAFGLEFLDMEAERIVKNFASPVLDVLYGSNSNIVVKSLANIFFHLFTWVFNSYGVITFDLLIWQRVKIFWANTYYFNHIIVVGVILLSPLLSRGKKSVEKSKKQK